MAVTETIQEILQGIDEAQYGRDMRQLIHKGIQKCYEDGSAGALDLDARESIEKILEIFGDVESTSTASKDYAIGDSLIYDGRLYKVTTAITEGDTIEEGTNIVETRANANVGDLYELPYYRITDSARFTDRTKLYIIPSIKIMILDVSIIAKPGSNTSGKKIGSQLPAILNLGNSTLTLRCAEAPLYGQSDGAVVYLQGRDSAPDYGSDIYLENMTPNQTSDTYYNYYGQIIARYTKYHSNYPLSSATLVVDE